MLAGIVISVVVVAGLAVAIPWLVAHRETPDVVDGDPTERFSDSMRIIRREIEDYAEDMEGAEVSTPLLRAAELASLRMLARSAARRRARTALLLVGATIVTAIVAGVTTVPWWAVTIPAALLVAFLVASPVMVRAMNRRFDARLAELEEGYSEDELTEVIHLAPKVERSSSFSIDLSAPESTGDLWEAAPVTAPTYVSKPLVPRTVRTIDLSQPVVAQEIVVPTADHPAEDVEELELEETEQIDRLRVVGE